MWKQTSCLLRKQILRGLKGLKRLNLEVVCVMLMRYFMNMHLLAQWGFNEGNAKCLRTEIIH